MFLSNKNNEKIFLKKPNLKAKIGTSTVSFDNFLDYYKVNTSVELYRI